MTNPPLPSAFLDRMRCQLGDELTAFLSAYQQPPLRGVRINPLKPVPLSTVPGAGAPVAWAQHAYELSMDSMAGAVPLHEAGAWYLQEPSAMLPTNVLNAQPGEVVLDLCAAPGGKSTQIGAAIAGHGLLAEHR